MRGRERRGRDKGTGSPTVIFGYRKINSRINSKSISMILVISRVYIYIEASPYHSIHLDL